MRIRHGLLYASGLMLLACTGSSVAADNSGASADDASTSGWPTSSSTSSAGDSRCSSTSSASEPTSSSSSSSTSGAGVCEHDDGVDVFADAFEKVEPTPYTTSIQETCELEAASADSADFICPEGGAIGVEVMGLPGVDFRKLPSLVGLDLELSNFPGKGGRGRRISFFDEQGSVLFAFSNGLKTAFGAEDPSWVSPLSLSRDFTACEPYMSNIQGVECRRLLLEVAGPGDAVAVAPGMSGQMAGWTVWVSYLRVCETLPEVVRFAIAAEAILR